MEARNGVVEVDGGRLVFEEAGRGYPLVMLHGFTLDRSMWDPQFLPLARQRRVIRFDQRGFGDSTLPDGPYRHVDDLSRLLGELGVSRADILGISMGGGIAVDFALTYPEAVRGLILADSTLNGFRWSAEGSDQQRLIFQAGREKGIDAAKELWLAHDFFAPAMRHESAAALLRDNLARYSGWHFVNRDPGSSPQPPAAEQLAEIHVPTLVIVGERDVPDIRAIAGLLASTIPNAKQIVIPGVGHLPNLEAPQEFNRVVSEFLDHLDTIDAPG